MMPSTSRSTAALLAALLASTTVSCANSHPTPDTKVVAAAKASAHADHKKKDDAEAKADAKLPKISIPYEKFVLDNGLTVLVHEDHKLPVVAVNVWYHVGSKDEHAGKTGFAHLFEHLMFQGSENFKGEYFEPLEKVGATDMNGTTNSDRTNYFETVPTSGLDVALWMESDRMGHLAGAISQPLLDEQRGVVENEKRQGENRAYGKAWHLIPPNTYPKGHPYSWPVIGSMDDLEAASLKDVKTWFKDYYGASNAVLVLAGDITVDQAKQKVQKYFGDIAPGKAVNHRGPWVAKLTERRELTTYDQVPQARAMYVYNVPQYGTDTCEYLRLAARLLATGKNSRLYKRLVYKDQIATDVSAWLDDGEIGSQLVIVADARPGVPLSKVEKALDDEVSRFAKDGPTADELERVKMRYFAKTLSSLQRVGGFGGKSAVLARAQTLLGDAGDFQQLMDVDRTATTAQIQQAAHDWLAGGVFVMQVLPNPNYHATKEKGADRSHVPEPGKAPKLDLPNLEHAQLSNGVHVVLAQRHDVPMVRLEVLAKGGFSTDPRDKLGLASLAMDVLDEGTDKYSSLELSAQLDKLGATLDSGASLANDHIVMSTLKTSLSPSLDLLSEVVLHPAFSKKEIERRREQHLDRIKQEKARPIKRALRLLGPLVYGDAYPYGVPLTGSGTADAVKALTRDDLVEFHKQALRPDNTTIVVVGDTTMKEIKPLLEKRFGEWQADNTKAKARASKLASHHKVRVILIDKPGAGQSLIFTGSVVPERQKINEIALETMNDVIGGVFSSRLNMNLREDKHWSYGARSFVYKTPGKQLFATYTSVQADKTTESMKEIKKEIDGYVGARPITAQELARTKQNRSRKLPGQNETIGRLMGHVAEVVKYGLPDDYWDTYSDKLQGLTLEQVRQAAHQAIHPKTLTWIVIGDLNRIEKKVRALKFGEVTVLDQNGQPVK